MSQNAFSQHRIRPFFPPRTIRLAVVLVLATALALLACAPRPAYADDDRGLAPAARRHVLVKVRGQGVTEAEADQDALRNARALAAKHLASLGGAALLDPSPQGHRVVNTHHYPALGFAPARNVVLVEFALRALPEPPAGTVPLPVLRTGVDAARILSIEANTPCEALVALDYGAGEEAEILPGGGGAAYRLAPGKPARLPLPPKAATLRILACTGGLNAPAAAPTVEDAFAKARTGKVRQGVMQGVISDCVTIRATMKGRETPARP